MNERTKRRARFLIDAAYIGVVVLLVYCAIKYVVGWVLPFILAFCVVSAIHPVIMRIVRTLNIKQEVASILVMILIYALLGSILILLAVQAVFLIRDALATFPDYYSSSIEPSFGSMSQSFASFIQGLPEPWQEQAVAMQKDLISSIQGFVISMSQRLIQLLSALTGKIPAFMITLVFTIMLSFFISTQYDKVVTFLKTQMPPRVRVLVRDVRLIIGKTIFKYLRAALTLMIITFIELSIGLLTLRQENAIPIAACIAVFDAMPFFGTGAIVIPWALISLIQGNYTFAAGLGILYLTVAFIRSMIEPKIVGDKLGLNPVVSLVSIYLGFKLIGVLGMIVMPITTQIVLELHREGSIKLFREALSHDTE